MKTRFKFENIVLEITEHECKEDIEQFNHLLMYYRTYGIQISINKVGTGTSNLERISVLAPDILKSRFNKFKANCTFTILSRYFIFFIITC